MIVESIGTHTSPWLFRRFSLSLIGANNLKPLLTSFPASQCPCTPHPPRCKTMWKGGGGSINCALEQSGSELQSAIVHELPFPPKVDTDALIQCM
jgi:hypothetical protein